MAIGSLSDSPLNNVLVRFNSQLRLRTRGTIPYLDRPDIATMHNAYHRLTGCPLKRHSVLVARDTFGRAIFICSKNMKHRNRMICLVFMVIFCPWGAQGFVSRLAALLFQKHLGYLYATHRHKVGTCFSLCMTLYLRNANRTVSPIWQVAALVIEVAIK